jgi:hypothetical protein
MFWPAEPGGRGTGRLRRPRAGRRITSDAWAGWAVRLRLVQFLFFHLITV